MKFNFRKLTGIHDVSSQKTCQETNRKTWKFNFRKQQEYKTFPIRKPAWKLTGIAKITIPEVFPEMKPLGNVIIFPV